MQFHFDRCRQCKITIGWSELQAATDRCPYCFTPLEENWRRAAAAERAPLRSEDDYARLLNDLEIIHYEDIDMAIAVGRAACDLTDADLPPAFHKRAQLIKANAIMRGGDLAEAGQAIRRINAWAERNRDMAVLARSCRHLSAFFFRLGDMSSALEQALHSLEYLPADSLPQTRGNHLMLLALSLDANGEYEEARRRYQEIMEIDAAIHHVQQELYLLNNMAYTRYEIGDVEEAERLAGQMAAFAERHGIPLVSSQLDTISRIELLAGRPEAAERTLRPLLDAYRSGRKLGDLFAMFECQITVAEAQRLQGHYERAQATLNEARGNCVKHGFQGFVARIRLEQAQLYAAMDRYKEAYEEYREYHAEADALRSSERETRARILHAVFETEEARRSSDRFRELAQRDPLTGLYNRRVIGERLDAMLMNATHGQHVTAVLVDVDHFKRINDTLSHETGDQVLVQVAKILDAAAIEPAKAARLGGEEFLLLCPGYDAAKGLDFAERLRAAIRSADWGAFAPGLAVTASLGVCTAAAGVAAASALLAEADRNLYAAKNGGRDRVVASRIEAK
ncbi:tetratricopeptide repeat-containing diguanylate cyclase [Paenibacillus methanolicus]|uniref:tetratricopeptide repeat-containing diguanylate cyclase n=1 Tax=Paenibacillus methanolicus TaxID=582686 RepID=UPI0011E889B0|nr:GGDEF domain-containing protein [Paenibacillus methanolicus]